jgi:hypothetical protein
MNRQQAAHSFYTTGCLIQQEKCEMRLIQITRTIQELNAAIDTGRHQGIPIEEVKGHIESGDLVQWLTKRVGGDIHLEFDDAAGSDWNEKMESIRAAYGGKEQRKWGVENSGLCLLVAWTTEIIQQRQWQD